MLELKIQLENNQELLRTIKKNLDYELKHNGPAPLPNVDYSEELVKGNITKSTFNQICSIEYLKGRVEELTKFVKDQEEFYNNQKNKVKEFLENSNEIEQKVFYEKYINGLSNLELIANKLGYSYEYVRITHAKIIKKYNLL